MAFDFEKEITGNIEMLDPYMLFYFKFKKFVNDNFGSINTDLIKYDQLNKTLDLRYLVTGTIPIHFWSEFHKWYITNKSEASLYLTHITTNNKEPGYNIWFADDTNLIQDFDLYLKNITESIILISGKCIYTLPNPNISISKADAETIIFKVQKYSNSINLYFHYSTYNAIVDKVNADLTTILKDNVITIGNI